MPVVAADVAEVVYYTADASSPITVLKPAAFMPGQILIVVVVQHAVNGLASLTGPSDWTDEGNYDDNGSGDTSGRVWSHVYDAADPSTWDFYTDSGAEAALALIRITGADTTPVIDVTQSIAGVSGGTCNSPSISPASINDLYIATISPTCLGAHFSASAPSGTTSRGLAQSPFDFMGLAVASKQLQDGTTVTAQTWTSVSPTPSFGGAFSIVVKSSSFFDPDPPPNPPPPIVPPHFLRALVEARRQPVLGDQRTPVVKQVFVGGNTNVAVTHTTSAKTVIGDLLVVFHMNNFFAASQLLTPTGTAGTWTLQATGDQGTNTAHIKVWTRLVTVDGAQTVTCTMAVDEEHAAHLYVLSGVDTTTYLDAAAGSQGAASTSHICPTVDPSTPNALLLVGTAGDTNATSTYTIPSTFGMIRRTFIDVAGIFASATGVEVRGNDSPTGTRTFTNSISSPFATASIAIKAPQDAVVAPPANAPAELADSSIAAQDSTSTVSTVSEASTLTIAGQDATTLVLGNAEASSITLTSQDASTSVNVNAECATFTVDAQDATVSTATGGTSANAESANYTVVSQDVTTVIAPTSETVTFAIPAQDATTSIQSAAIESATTIASQDATPSVGAAPSTSTFTLSAQDSTTATSTTPTSADYTLTSQDVSTSIAGTTSEGPVVFVSDNPQVSLGVTAEVSSFTTSAQDVTSKVAPVVEVASFTFSAQDATVVTGSFTNANAEVAQIAFPAQDSTSKVSITSEVAAVVVAGQDGNASVSVSSQVVTLTFLGQDSTTKIDVASALAAIGLAGNDLGSLVSVTVEAASIILVAQQATAQTATYGWPLVVGIPNTPRLFNVGVPTLVARVNVGVSSNVQVVSVGIPTTVKIIRVNNPDTSRIVEVGDPY